jgi:hypothetical protein
MHFENLLPKLRSIAKVGASTAFSVLVLWGCAEPPAPPTPPAPQPTPPAFTLPISINEVMVGPLDHAAHELWNVALEENEPRTDEDWVELEHHATTLLTLATTIKIPGTGVGDALWVQGDEWSRYADELSVAAMTAVEATRAKDLPALLAAGDQLLPSCLGCHSVYKPDIPSEGDFHSPYRQ